MAYATYTTDAIVCGSTPRNAADRRYLLLTREAGMLAAVARSVREERSKQRCALQEFSVVRASLVKGRHEWKVGSVEAQRNYYHEASDQAARGSVVNVIRLVRRFVHGAVTDETLFTLLDRGLSELSGAVPDRTRTELLVKLHLLHQLGYVDVTILPTVQRTTFAAAAATSDDAVLAELFEHAITSSQL